MEDTRRPSRATDLYAAFLLYTAPTPITAHVLGTHTREILSVSKSCLNYMYSNLLPLLLIGRFRACLSNKTNIPRKGIARPQSQFPHSCVCERFSYTVLPQLVCLFCCRECVDRSWEYTNRSQTCECGNWD